MGLDLRSKPKPSESALHHLDYNAPRIPDGFPRGFRLAEGGLSVFDEALADIRHGYRRP